jgi:hypothetical protein
MVFKINFQRMQKKISKVSFFSKTLLCILLAIPLSIFTLSEASAQIGGQYTFGFLKQSASARLTGLGKSQIAQKDDDLSIGFTNPSMYNALMHNGLSYNHDFLLGGVGTGYFGYGYHVDKWKTTFQAGIQYISYGTFKQTDELGNIVGAFKAAEYAITLGVGHAINERLSVGMNLKFITSRLEAYKASGIAADLAGAYFNPEKNMGITVIFKNIGTQLATYTPDRNEDLPLDVQVGFSKKLARAPFRFSIALHDLNRWNLRYDNPFENEISLLGEAPQEPSALSKFSDNLFRHINLGGELVFGKNENLRVRFGYSHQARKELNVNNIRSTAGFSFGVGFKVNRFRVDYGLGRQHVAGSLNHLSISTNFLDFKKG